MSLQVLIVDDEENARAFLRGALEDAGYEAVEASDLAEAHAALDTGAADVVILDLVLPDGNGISLLDRIAREAPSPPVIVVTAFGEVDTAVEAMKKGAIDYLQKPIDLEQLVQTVDRCRQIVAMRRELEVLRRASLDSVEMIVGETPAMKRVMMEAERAAKASVSVLVTGESGTGKEMLVQAIRNMGPRADKPFVPINCAALPETMIESELFGYEPGAFTGATKRKPGLIEVADGGILFLDEISETTPEVQAKLLRVVEEQRFRRVGGVKEIQVDIQIIAASNRDLQAALQGGRFRADLYYRLKLVDLHLPPLRERREDIPALVGAFIRKHNPRLGTHIRDVTPRAIEALQGHDWPGNIRELEHVIQRAMLFCDDEVLDLGHLPPEFHPA